ncbi:MAG: CBS domain-containing protein [Gammaproteobacteria bacterium]|nr:CBS domain-containing protein [Gammaproteobacteria bacterium]
MTSIAQILRAKADQSIFMITPTASVRDAAELMARHNIGCLLVQDGPQVIGILSERDLTRKVVAAGRAIDTTPVRDIMAAPVRCVTPQQTNTECMAVMTELRLRHLPVLEQDRLVGLVSIGDLVKDIISEQQFIIEQLEHYIVGKRA